jgi:hypothetical protein
MVLDKGGFDVTRKLLQDVRTRKWFVGLLLVGTAIVLGGSGCDRRIREAPPDQVCGEQLKDIGKAIVEYRKEHGDLPHVVPGPGGLQHSWRTLLTPSLIARCDFGNTLDYRFTEPWDSPHNRDALRNCLVWNMYICPLESREWGYPSISYVMLVRPAVKDAKTGRLVDPPLPGDAVLIVESAHCGIKHFEPKDLDWDTLWKGDSPFGPGKLNSLHRDVVKAVRVDGKVIDIPKTINKDKLRKLLSGTVRE